MDKEEEMLEAVMKVAEGDAPKVKKGMDVLFDNILNKGMMPRDALGIQDSDTESLYAQAYQMYNMGKYKEARNVFSSLIMIDSLDPRFLFGFAACAHMMEEYGSAADMYTQQAMISPDDPIPYYHAADCYIKLKDTFSATVALNLVVKRSGDDPKYTTIKERSEMTVKTLEKQLEEEVEELGTPEDIAKPEQPKGKEKTDE